MQTYIQLPSISIEATALLSLFYQLVVRLMYVFHRGSSRKSGGGDCGIGRIRLLEDRCNTPKSSWRSMIATGKFSLLTTAVSCLSHLQSLPYFSNASKLLIAVLLLTSDDIGVSHR